MGVLSVLVGGLVLVGWALDIAIFKSILPGWVSMKPNTALCFMLVGWALLTTTLSSFPLAARVVRLCTLLAGLIGVLTLGEYVSGINLGIDQWLFREPADALDTSHPGRMAPDTALCFVLLAAALWLVGGTRKPAMALFAAVVLGILVAAMGLAQLLYLVTPPITNVGWWGLTAMSLHAAALFMALGVAVILYVLRQHLPLWALSWWTTVAFACGLGVVVCIGLYTSHCVVWLTEVYHQITQGELVHQWKAERVALFCHLVISIGTVASLVVIVSAMLRLNRAVTERQLFEERLVRTLHDLERSNKDLEQFAYVASHDLQEPLRMVASFTQLLSQHYEGLLDDTAKKYIAYAVDGALRMQQLINGLLAYSRVGTRSNAVEPNDTQTLLGKVIGNLFAAIEESQAVVTNDELPTVHADATQLLQLFQNLVANAIKFRKPDEAPHVHVSARDLGHEWLFAVQDNGIGIEARHKDKLFVIFQRLHTRQEYPGTGIGLALCQRIVAQHGGRIWFESEPGQGSTFYFTLPK
jgi:signal transduction histidine kinase